MQDEFARLAIMRRYNILDTPPEAAFDRITALAADVFDAPISILSFVGHDRVCFKSHHGFAATYVDRGPGKVAAAIDPWIRRQFRHGFHVGVTLRTSDGYDLGQLSVIDRRPRRVDAQQIRHLKSLADIVMDQLELRLSARRAAARAETMTSTDDSRAMASLQLVASLLHLQSRAVKGTETALQLTTAANRVLAVARVHRNSSANEADDRMPILAYLRRLCGELSCILAADITVEGVEKSVATTQIIAIGLIANELVTNAFRHGAGPIRVSFISGTDGEYELCVLDEGDGLPEGFAVGRPSGGLGMKVVATLTGQLAGQLRASPNPAGRGARFTVTFPINEQGHRG
jgi:two-component sensor histidine kinase